MAMRQGAQPSGPMMLLLALGSVGPSLVAIAMVAWQQGRSGLRQLLWKKPALSLRLSLVALGLSAACHLIGSGVLMAAGSYQAEHLLYLPLLPEHIAIAIVAPLGEEYGWRGYALPRLQTKLSPLSASLIIGVVWALWHLPTLLVPGARGTTGLELWMYLLAMVAGSVIYTWLYNAGHGSLRGPVLAHLGIHLDNVFRASTMGDGTAPLTSTAVVMTVVAVGLVAWGRLKAPQREHAVAVE